MIMYRYCRSHRGERMQIDRGLLYQHVRNHIKHIRTAETETTLTQAQLGEILGLTRSTVANLESGAQRTSLHNLYVICAHFGLELTDLLPSVAEMVRRTSELPSANAPPSVNHVLEMLKQG